VTSESNIMRSIMLACSRGAVRLFRQNTGQAWVGDVVSRGQDTITLRNYRPLHVGICKGSSDLVGWTSVVITPDMVGQRVAVFSAVECKTAKGRASAEQTNFINAVIQAGGRAGVARSSEEALRILDSQPGR
jgi:VRR-NUC domain